MIGSLTIDKASMNISYFLYSIILVAQNNNKISRSDFVEKMASFVGLSASKDGKENRTPYNKSKLPRYFGFISIEVVNNDNFLVLTNRGKNVLQLIEDNENLNNDMRFSIKENKRQEFANLIIESIVFDSFGKNNCGAEQSRTDVEPPKILFKLIYDLQCVTAEEFCYVIFGLNSGLFNNYKDAKEKVKNNRNLGKYDYTNELKNLNALNIARDCKIINIFTDQSIGLLRSVPDNSLGKTFYHFTDKINDYYKNLIKNISPIYLPLRLLISFDDKEEQINWINNTILGSVYDKSNILDLTSSICPIGNINENNFPGDIEKIILSAFKNNKTNYYILSQTKDENELITKIGKYSKLLPITNELSNQYNGWSKNNIIDKSVYEYLYSNYKDIKKYLNNYEIRFPSNIHIIGVIDMKPNDENYDFKFTRTIVKKSENRFVSTNKSTDGCNKIYYGAPGCGKSFKINEDLGKVIKENKIRVTFHPEYANCDFVGQILPTIEEKDGEEVVKYVFNPGPFTLALLQSYKTDEMVYLIIEEINRGNAAAIFGDLFQLLDRKENGESEYPICNPNIQKYLVEELKKDGIDLGELKEIVIPSNLSIFATMNSSDQNVFTLDTAFKRRWSFVQIPNDIKKDTNHTYKEYRVPGTNVKWEDFLTKINDEILKIKLHNQISEDKRLGKYFVSKSCLTENEEKIEDVEEIAESFAYKVLEYIWNDVCKIGKEEWFDVEKYKTLEDLVDAFVHPNKSEGKTPLSIFQNISF